MVSQKTYVIMMQSNEQEDVKKRKSQNLHQKGVSTSKYGNDFGGAFEFTQDLEKKILNILGKFLSRLLNIFFNEPI